MKHHINDLNWLETTNGDPRGYIDPEYLKELWFHTGTACNLSCPFCFEESGPGDKRIGAILFDEAIMFIDEANEFGVEKFCFTGGEPFVNKDFIRILNYALESKPCLVLTNGTDPLHKRFDDILPLRDKPNTLSFRVSLDSPDSAIHDLRRGQGNFDKAIKGLVKLYKAGFAVSIARQVNAGENISAVDAAYREVLSNNDLPENLNIVAFPNLKLDGETPQITEDCMTTYCSEQQRRGFMCNSIKMIAKKSGTPGVFACTLVDNDDDYNLGTSLRESMDKRVMLRHKRCYSCFSQGVSCCES